MDRPRLRRELGRVRALVAGAGLIGVCASSATILGCTLHCQMYSVPVSSPARVERAEGESDEALLVRCLEACRSSTYRTDVRCVLDEQSTPLCAWDETRGCEAGRAPVGGFAWSERGDFTDRDAFLRTQVALELASVFAFEELAASLRAWDANPGFIRAATRFADDERRHAARLFAAIESDVAVRVQREAPRGPELATFARHNAAEACVGEAFGACLAAHQARHAADDTLRSTYASIAADESAHARFAIALDRWARKRLSRSEVRAIDDAHAESLQALRGRLDAPLGPEGLGLPSRDDALAIFDSLFA